MAKQQINIGTAANSGNGDPIRSAFTKVNENFTELYDDQFSGSYNDLTDKPIIPSDINDLTDNGNLLNNTEFTHIELTDSEVSFTGPVITFAKTSYGSEVDYIDIGLAITRGDSKGIYNAAIEEGYNQATDTAPTNTEWNNEGWSDLSNVAARTYTTWRTAVNTNPTESIGQELIMHDVANDKYYGIKFLSWQQGEDPGGPTGGAFSYIRQLIDVGAGKGITFPDESILRTGNVITVQYLKTIAAASTDFDDFKARIASL